MDFPQRTTRAELVGPKPATRVDQDTDDRPSDGRSDSRSLLVFAFALAAALCPAVGTFLYLQFGDREDAHHDAFAEPDVLSLSQTLDFARPIPTTVAVNVAKASLGERLFNDPRLSKNGKVACATCHDFDHGGADPRRYSIGVSGGPVMVNTPTVFNALFNSRQFWDGRAQDLAEQAEGPVLKGDEMGSIWVDVIVKLSKDQAFLSEFKSVYPDGLTRNTIVDAIAAYEMTLSTPNSPFDRYLNGDKEALSPIEKRGLELFETLGCSSCHQGVNLGGNMFGKMGVVNDFFAGKQDPIEADLGRYNVTGRDEDRHVFKVPSLRNVALTSPYLHDGSVPTLETAAQVMAWYQLGVRISDEETEALAAFMRALTGELPTNPS